MLLRVLASVSVLGVLASAAHAGDWPAFRGPQGNGVVIDDAYPAQWSHDENIKWKIELPAAANGSPIVSAGRVFVACATDEGRRRILLCFDRADGSELWRRTVEFDEVAPTHKTNPYCGSTPAADGQKVVVWHGSAGLYCYDFDGNELWSNDPGDVRHVWGYGSSPVLHRGVVLLNFGPGEQSCLLAVDLKAGKTLWKTPEPGGRDDTSERLVGSWSTPVIANVDGAEQIICSMPTRVVAYDFDTGKIVWTCGGLPSERGDLVYTSPVVAGDIGVAMGGYHGPSMAFKLGGSGDVTETHRLWHAAERQPQRIGSGVIVGDWVFVANADSGTAQCIELATGREVWRARLSGGAHWGSIVLADDRLYVTNQSGTTHVFAPNPDEFELLASNALDEPSNATPAFSSGEIFIRTEAHLYCIAE